MTTPTTVPDGTVTVLGVPWDEHSSFLRGAAAAPARIREMLHSGSSNWSTEAGVDLAATRGWADVGDVTLGNGQQAREQIEQAVTELLADGTHVLTLGGDHAITYPILRAYGRAYSNLSVLHLDAHPDLYDELNGDRYSHACPFARAMEERLVAQLVQVGIRTMNPHQQEQADRFGVTVISMRDWTPDTLPELHGPVYLSLDLDVLDPAFAPGVSHHEPGGLSTRDVLRLLHRLPNPIVGADIVELNPSRDPTGTTAMVAAKFYKELVGRML